MGILDRDERNKESRQVEAMMAREAPTRILVLEQRIQSKFSGTNMGQALQNTNKCNWYTNDHMQM